MEGFYDGLLQFIQLTTDKEFTRSRFTNALINSASIDDILEQFENFTPPEPKWGVKDHDDLVKVD